MPSRWTAKHRVLDRRFGLFSAASAAVVAVCALALSMVLIQPASAATQINLGTAEQFAVLAGAGVTNTGTTTIQTQSAGIRGDGGTSPLDTVTGEASVHWLSAVPGTWHRADEVAQIAQADNLAAYNTAAGAASSASLGGQIDGSLLTPGVYTASSALNLATNGTVTFDAQGDPEAVFIIQVGSSLTTEVNSTVSLVNGAQACHVFWQVGADATLKANSNFVGTLLAKNAIVAQSGTSIEGRLLAQVASVTLDTNTFVVPSCQQAVATTPAPEETTPAPEETTPAPEETTPAPEETTPAPEETTPAPEETTPAPEETTPAPEETTPAPEETTPAPEETTPAAEETTPVPEETTPVAGRAIPLPEETTPVAGAVIPLPEEATPAEEESIPTPEETIPAGRTSTPEETITEQTRQEIETHRESTPDLPDTGGPQVAILALGVALLAAGAAGIYAGRRTHH